MSTHNPNTSTASNGIGQTLPCGCLCFFRRPVCGHTLLPVAHFSGRQAKVSTSIPTVSLPMYLCNDDYDLVPSNPIVLRYHQDLEEIALGPACWLWDYMRYVPRSTCPLPALLHWGLLRVQEERRLRVFPAAVWRRRFLLCGCHCGHYVPFGGGWNQ